MVSLCYRNLISYITDDNLAGLQNYFENKRVQVDDRDEVRIFVLIKTSLSSFFKFDSLNFQNFCSFRFHFIKFKVEMEF